MAVDRRKKPLKDHNLYPLNHALCLLFKTLSKIVLQESPVLLGTEQGRNKSPLNNGFLPLAPLGIGQEILNMRLPTME